MDQGRVSRLLAKYRRRLAAVSASVAVVSVMAFGQIKYTINLIRYRSSDYEPIHMVFMLLPIGLVMGLVSWSSSRSLARRLRRSGRKTRSPSRRPLAAETVSVAAAAAVSSGLIEYASASLGGAVHVRTPLLSIGLAVPVGTVVGGTAFLLLRSLRRDVLEWIAASMRESAGTRRPAAPKAAMAARLKSAQALRNSRIMESAVIVVGSVMTFGLIEYVANVVVRKNADYRPIDMVGMILPMGLIMGIISFVSLKVVSRALLQLMAGIDKVASGDFFVELDGARAGPYRDVFESFNTMSRELRSIQTLRDDFTNQFSHEFKTPLASISGFAELLLEEGCSDEQRRRYLGIIAAESARLSEMSSNSLLIAKLETQHYVVDKKSYALDEQLRQCVILLSPLWTRKGIDVSADLEPASFTGNADLLKHVWINLLSNAIKFTPPGGVIRVGLRREGDWLAATISDTGRGMSAEELYRAFEKYYQGGAGVSSKGLGLGLSIVRRILDLCGGRIEARSVPTKGSAFTVLLPA
jgi:signal transduction histidine kinase